MFQVTQMREFAALKDEVGVLSLYTTLEPGAPTGAVRLHNQLAHLHDDGMADLDPERARMVVERLDELEGEIDTLLDPAEPGRGRALFAQVAGDLVRTTWIQVPVGDQALLDTDARLWPLAVAAQESAPAGVIRVGRDGIRFFDLRYGLAEELSATVFNLAGADWDRTGDPTMPAYSRRGIHPDKFDQRVEEHLAKYLRESAPLVDEAARRHGWETIVLVGDPRSTSLLKEEMTTQVPAVEHDAILDPYLSPAEVLDSVQPVLTQARADRDAELADHTIDLAKSGGNAALGLHDVLSMLKEGRVDRLLLATHGTWQTIPVREDGETVTGEALGDHLIHLALEQGGSFGLLQHEAGDKLADHEGVAALLRW